MGMYARVARLSDGTLIAVSRDARRKLVAVTYFNTDGRIVGRHSIGGRIMAGGTGHPEAGGDGGWWPAVAVEPNDTIHVVWHEATAGALLYSRGTAPAGFGEPEVVDGAGPEVVGTHADLALDGLGGVHVAYRNETTKSLRYARRDLAGHWLTEDVPVCAGEATCPVSAVEDYGTDASLALTIETGGAIVPRIAFFDALREDLKLAARGSASDASATPWQVTTLDGRSPNDDHDTGRVGRFASLAMTPARSLVAAYFDESRGALRFLSPGAAPRILDSGDYTTPDGRKLTSKVGQFARMRVDAGGAHHIIYFDATRLIWKYLRLQGELITERYELDALSPGGWLDFVPTEHGLVGAYGALSRRGELRTELRWFQL